MATWKVNLFINGTKPACGFSETYYLDVSTIELARDRTEKMAAKRIACLSDNFEIVGARISDVAIRGDGDVISQDKLKGKYIESTLGSTYPNEGLLWSFKATNLYK